MARSISSILRRKDLITLTVPVRTGKTGFRFSFATNFSGAFINLQVVPNYGYKSLSIPDGATSFASGFKNQAVFIFRPSDYTAAIPTMVDGIPLYFRIEARNPDGSFDTPEAMHLVLPNEMLPSTSFVLRGVVPSGANLAASLEIQLPSRCQDWQIKVDTGSSLEVAFEAGGPEFLVLPESTSSGAFQQVITSTSQLFLRGSGGTSSISAIFTVNNSPIFYVIVAL